MLELAAARMLARTEYVWRDMEDDRLGFAIARTLTRPDLSADQATGWLRPVLADFRAAEPGPMPPHASNTIRTLRVVYLLADRGIQPRGAEGVVPVGCAGRRCWLRSRTRCGWSSRRLG